MLLYVNVIRFTVQREFLLAPGYRARAEPCSPSLAIQLHYSALFAWEHRRTWHINNNNNKNSTSFSSPPCIANLFTDPTKQMRPHRWTVWSVGWLLDCSEVVTWACLHPKAFQGSSKLSMEAVFKQSELSLVLALAFNLALALALG